MPQYFKMLSPSKAHLHPDNDDVSLQHRCRCAKLIKASPAAAMNASSTPPHCGSRLVPNELVSIHSLVELVDEESVAVGRFSLRT